MEGLKRPSGSITYCYADGNLQWHAGSSSGARVEMHLKGTWNGSNNNTDAIFSNCCQSSLSDH